MRTRNPMRLVGRVLAALIPIQPVDHDAVQAHIEAVAAQEDTQAPTG